MIDKDLLSILVCPETREDLENADESIVNKINEQIEQGMLVNRAKEKVTQKIDGALKRVGETQVFYPVREGIPILLIDEQINLEA